jgi:hypothetical protein
VADGTSCRHQIRDGAQRQAVHVARWLDELLNVQLNSFDEMRSKTGSTDDPIHQELRMLHLTPLCRRKEWQSMRTM